MAGMTATTDGGAPADEPILIASVERELDAGARYLRFVEPIEEAYRRDSRDERVRLFLVSSLVATVLYDGFLANDWMTLRDVFPAMAIARIAIFTPVILFCMLLVSRSKSTLLREGLGVFANNLAVFLPMTVQMFSDSSYRFSYQFGSLLVMVFGAVIQRLPFRYAAVSISGALFIQSLTTYLGGALDWTTWCANVVFFSTAAALLLLAAYFLERADRLSYLFSLRGRLLHTELAKAASTDPLTQLHNRRHLADVVAAVWAKAQTERTLVTAILIDIDHFKAFNDTYGHLQGDTCLRTLSACIGTVAAEEGIPAFRFGGEEMLVLLPGRPFAQAWDVAERVRAALLAAAVPHPVLGEGAIVTASLGVAGVVAPEMTPDALIAAADTALYAAKRAGRNAIWPPRGGEIAASCLSTAA